jgi:ParB family chromosome partitioning protein
MSGFNLNDILNERTKNAAVPLWNFKHIPLEQIVPSPNNKYRICDIEELADSIEVDGLLHNLTVRKLPDSGEYELISGERRFRALQLLVSRGLERFAAAPCKVEVELSDIAAKVQLIRANSTARNLTDQERVWQANELKGLLTDLKKSGVKLPGRVRKLAADELGISQSQMGRMESISDNLVPEAKEEFEKGNINMTAAYETSRLPAKKQAEVVDDLRRGVKADIKTVKSKRNKAQANAPLPPADTAVPESYDDDSFFAETEAANKNLMQCPFCGSNAYINYIAPHKHYIADLPDYSGGAFVECAGCTCAISADTISNAVAAWNRRTKQEGKKDGGEV